MNKAADMHPAHENLLSNLIQNDRNPLMVECIHCRFGIRLNRQSLPKHNPVTVWSDYSKFAHSPWLVREFVPNLHTVLDGFFV